MILFLETKTAKCVKGKEVTDIISTLCLKDMNIWSLKWLCRHLLTFVCIVIIFLPIGDIKMTTFSTTRLSRLPYERPKQKEVTTFLDDGKLIVICFSEHVKTFKNKSNYIL